MKPDDELRAILLRAFPACRVEECEELPGGISCRAVVVRLRLSGDAVRRVVVRRPHRSTAEERMQALASEHQVLSCCAVFGIPAPQPCFLDVQATALVLEYIEGTPEFAPARAPELVQQMAAQLARIHRVAAGAELEALQRRRHSAERDIRHVPERFDESLDERELRAQLALLWPWPQRNPDVLLHGDYWPGNVLWRDGKLVAVLDWEETEVGDPLADVAVARLDLAWAFGEGAMHEFTLRYREQTDLDWGNLPRWDLCVALRPMSNLARWAECFSRAPISRPDVTEASMRAGHRRFVQQALRSLGLD